MKQFYIIIYILFTCVSCQNKTAKKNIEGTWKMIYAETKEGDSIQIKELSHTVFIKVINETHFAFFNQDDEDNNKFYSGGGTYTYQGTQYAETLSFTSVESIRNHEFPFIVNIKGDTLIQRGIEEVKSAGIKREIIEKYIKIN